MNRADLKNLVYMQIAKTLSQRCLRTRHAERSALDYSQAKVATAYVTHEPCLRCTQDLIARGCKVIYFEVAYFGSLEEAEARARLVSESGATKVQLHLACHNDGRAALQAPTTPTIENINP